MADYYATQYIGARDGTASPPNMVDGREIDAKKRCIRATVDSSKTYASGDRIYLGRLPLGAVIKTISLCSDTTFGTATLSVGTTATANKYVNAKTMTMTDVPTALGPRATAAVQAPLAAIEEIWATFGTAGLASGVNAAFNIEYTISA